MQKKEQIDSLVSKLEVGISKNKQKYLCAGVKNNILQANVLYLLNGKIVYGLKAADYFSRLPLLDRAVDLKAVKNLDLVAALIKAMPTLDDLKPEVNCIGNSYPEECDSGFYQHQHQSWFEWILTHEEQLLRLGIDSASLVARIGEVEALKIKAASDRHSWLIENAVSLVQKRLLENYTKEQIVQKLDEFSFMYRPSWGKGKLASAFEPSSNWAINFLDIPQLPSLKTVESC